MSKDFYAIIALLAVIQFNNQMKIFHSVENNRSFFFFFFFSNESLAIKLRNGKEGKLNFFINFAMAENCETIFREDPRIKAPLAHIIIPKAPANFNYSRDSIYVNCIHFHFTDPPQVTLSLGSTLNPDDIKEGDDVYFECHIKANPKEHRITWSHDVS